MKTKSQLHALAIMAKKSFYPIPNVLYWVGVVWVKPRISALANCAV